MTFRAEQTLLLLHLPRVLQVPPLPLDNLQAGLKVLHLLIGTLSSLPAPTVGGLRSSPDFLDELLRLLLPGGGRSSGTCQPGWRRRRRRWRHRGTVDTPVVIRVRARLLAVIPRSKPSEGSLARPDVFLADVLTQLGVRGAHLATDPALSHLFLRLPPGHLVAVGVGDVLQEDLLGQTNEHQAFVRTKHATEDLEGVNIFRDSDQIINVLLVRLLDAVLLGHVLHHVFELLKPSAALVPGIAHVAVEELVGMDLSPAQTAVEVM